ncbi:hypothetical protein QTL97_12135 [Sporosarcina thermotolerans]|uniref:SnoaL-like domain-containing protein n=1 Tax=Sporosarcina thermotolerans TaxID=633404 RepID=A0AAW9A9G0_9BACL|nr:hypothetical protein [Sporosarcina thermotolerans]MDW0117689.1 hypothetical protein [Sporosarcina thermotolerans]WHT49222.1 hypothetical protein QNH10_06255 [Sporosarcina thermotolerans]
MIKILHQKRGLSVFLVVICLVFVGCSKPDEQEENRETIKTVIGLQLNAPNEKAIILNYMSDSSNDNAMGLDEYTDYLKETYAAYFTQSTFEQYVMMNELVTFHEAAVKFDYQLQVNNIEVAQNKVTATNYDFIVNLDYVNKDGEKTAIQLTGIAIMRDDKIAKISYIGDKKVLRSLLSGGLTE